MVARIDHFDFDEPNTALSAFTRVNSPSSSQIMGNKKLCMCRHVWDNFSRAWFMGSWPMLMILLVLVSTLFYQNEPGTPSFFGLKSPINSLLFGVLQEAQMNQLFQFRCFQKLSPDIWVIIR